MCIQNILCSVCFVNLNKLVTLAIIKRIILCLENTYSGSLGCAMCVEKDPTAQNLPQYSSLILHFKVFGASFLIRDYMWSPVNSDLLSLSVGS